MAVSYTVPNTFSALTVAESAKVNANEQYTKAVFDGLEATTKTLAKLKMDANPAAAMEVAVKQYVDYYATYRRPNLVWVSNSTVTIETGINATSGQARILFPDGNLRTDSTASHITFDITRNAVLSGTAQSGLRTSLSEASNTIYAIYAVKVSDSTTDFVLVGDTVAPSISNYSTIVSNFGANNWVFLGYIMNGSVATQTTDICKFTQAGPLMMIRNILATANVPGSSRDKFGVRMANTASATSLTSSPTQGIVVGTNYPETASMLYWTAVFESAKTQVYAGDSLVSSSAGTVVLTMASIGGIEITGSYWLPSSSGAGIGTAGGSAGAASLIVAGWYDGALGVGSNPLY
jgi:hypothetical protein